MKLARAWIALLGLSLVSSLVCAAGGPLTVTLITGDQVVIGAPQNAVSIRPGKNRTHIRFSIDRVRSHDGKTEHVRVIPEDAIPLIAADRIDPLLFDITGLVKSGYDDASTGNLPLIMTYPQSAAGRPSLSSLSALGANVEAQLSSVNGAAVQVPKEQTSQLWASLTAGPSALSGAAKIWLDRMFELALDQSVPQIGAPAAWSLGYTGRGIKVAVIDSGADISHPDLAGRIVGYRNFTEETDNDIHGHGTHVASTIAGSGAASNGRYRGVAPDAQLVIGKACIVSGCPESLIIAALQWAVVEQRARIVNMSLGTIDSPGVDPMEMAVNRLTASHGALVVAAAGNLPLPGAVSSPSSADAALSVGAIDRDDQLAFFSSAGPRPGDKAIKPEITAPGVQVVAARAAGTGIGNPIDDFYTAVDGTSMAAPHVAGAAAILAQRHPGWTPAQLKAALMGSAKVHPTLSVFEQGAGRLDVAAAIASRLVTEPAALSLGVAFWPHDDGEIITRTVTYRNLSSEALTLDLRLNVRGPDGNAAPAGMFRITPAVLSVPAGGTATVTLTADTTPGLLGLYTGRLEAVDRADARTIHSLPLGMEREVESYPVVLNHVDRDGQVASQYITFLAPLDRPQDIIPFAARLVVGEVTIRLPRGRYIVDSRITTPSDGSLSVLLRPVLDVTAPRSMTIDARIAKPVILKGPPAAQMTHEEIGFVLPGALGLVGASIFAEGQSPIYTSHLGPPVEDLTSFVIAGWEAESATQPESYASAWVKNGVYHTGLIRTVRPENMAVVHANYAPVRPDLTRGTVIASPTLGNGTFLGAISKLVDFPFRRTEYYAIEPGFAWTNALLLTLPGTESFPLFFLETAPIRYVVPSPFSARWSEAPYGPSPNAHSRTAERSGDTLQLAIRLFGDRAGHSGGYVFEGLFNSPRLALYRNGTQLGEIQSLSGTFEVPPEASTYRLEASVTQEMLELSKQISVAWTFPSSHVSGDKPAPLPLLTAQFKPPLNAQGEAAAGSVVRVPISVTQDGRSGPPHIKNLSLDVSFDEGSTWTRAPVRRDGHQWVAVITHPAQGQYVSLRTAISDFAGNSVEQTLIRAYALKPAE